MLQGGGFLRPRFKAQRGVTQGNLLSSTIFKFNLMVDAVLREWEPQLVVRGLCLDNVRQLFACSTRTTACWQHGTLSTSRSRLIC